MMKALPQHRAHQLPPSLLTPSKTRLQPITQRHQFVDFGDDAVLFGEGWEGEE